MRIMSFKKQFKGKLLSCAKISTMRIHKRPHRKGDTVQVWCPGPRCGHGKKQFEARIDRVSKIRLFKDELGFDFETHIEGFSLTPKKLAKMEGFDSAQEMFEWFQKNHDISKKDLTFTRYDFRKLED